MNVCLAVVGPTIDTTTGLQLQQTATYTALPAQYPIYAPTAIYSHLPTTTLIPSALASPGKEGLHFIFILIFFKTICLL